MTRRSRFLASAGAVLVAGGVAAAVLVSEVDDAPTGPAQIVFQRGEGVNPAIYVMAADGAAQRELVPYGSAPSWSPGGHRVAFVVHSPPEDEAPPDELWVVGADGSDARRAVRDDWISELAWSPDGARIAWVNTSGWPGRDSLAVVDLRTGKRRALASPVGYLGSLDWSPDGRQLLTIVSGDVVAVDVASGGRRTIRDEAYASKAVWSPDGSRIAYAADPAPPVLPPGGDLTAGPFVIRLDHSIFVMNADGGGVRRLTRGAIDSSPNWARGGRAIVFSRADVSDFPREWDTSLYSISVGDRKARRLTTGADDGEPDWRPARRAEPSLGIPRAALPEPSAGVPDVQALDPREAARAIEAAGLRPIVRQDSGPRSQNVVVRQSPSPGARVPPGTAVVVTYDERPSIGLRPAS